MSANDIPADIADAIYRLRYVDKPMTRIERAFLCGVLCAMQMNLAERLRDQQEPAEIIPFPKKPTEPDDARRGREECGVITHDYEVTT